MNVFAPNNTGLVSLRSVVYLRASVKVTLFALYVEIIPDEKIEQRIDFKFLVKLWESATESFRLFTDVYGDDVTSRPRVFEWHKRFREVREEIDDLRPSWSYFSI